MHRRSPEAGEAPAGGEGIRVRRRRRGETFGASTDAPIAAVPEDVAVGATRWIAPIRPTNRETDCSGLSAGDAGAMEVGPPAKGMSRVELFVLEAVSPTGADAADGRVRAGAVDGTGGGELLTGGEPLVTSAGRAIKLDSDVGEAFGTFAGAGGAVPRRSRT